MKTFITALVLAAITVSGGILCNMQIDKAAKNMSEREKIISQQIEDGDFDAALEKINELIEYIDKKRTVLASTIDHKSIDEIEACVSEIRGCAEQGEGGPALVKCRRLEHLVKHLPTNYSLTLQNIL